MPEPGGGLRVGGRLARGLRRLVLLAVAWLLLRTWIVEGLIGAVVVPTGSMAPALLGNHREVTCADCGYVFPCGTDYAAPRELATCPNCGFGENSLAGLPIVGGDRVLLDRSAFLWRSPRRWEVIAFRHPHQGNLVCAKRVVGLPGETIQIRDGDVYINGQIARKTLAQQRALALPVYDADHPPAHDAALLPRWRGAGWQIADGKFAHAPTNGAAVEWCAYHHQERALGGGVREAPVVDDVSYAPGWPRRMEDYHTVNDLMLSFRLVRCVGEGELQIRASDGSVDCVARFDARSGRWEGRVIRQARPGDATPGLGLLESSVSSPPPPSVPECLSASVPSLLTISLIDRQWLVAADDQVLFSRPLETTAPPGTSQPFAIGCRGVDVELADVRLVRDVYYTHPLGIQGRWGLDQPLRVAADAYYVLGDNSPVSDDSRLWPGGPDVPGRLIQGKPLAVFFPMRRYSWWGWHFQLPDRGRMRYIR